MPSEHCLKMNNLLTVCLILTMLLMTAFTAIAVRGTGDVYHELKTLEGSLSESEKESETLYDMLMSTGSAFVEVGKDGSIVKWNRQAEVLFGFTADEIVGKQHTTLVPDGYRERHDAAFGTAMSRGKSSHRVITCLAHKKDGDHVGVVINVWVMPGQRAVALFTPVEEVP